MSDQTPCVPDDAEQPDGIADDSFDLPGKALAAGRVNEFLSWFGDGRVYLDDPHPALFARDLQSLANAALADAAPGINIVLAASGDTSTFVEIEDDNGDSITVGTVHTDDADPMWRIRITGEDFERLAQQGRRAAATEPNGCRACGTPERSHYRRWSKGVGWHQHIAPTDAQRKTRMVARREARADDRTDEERRFVEEALRCVASGRAGHWPTVAGYLADEVVRLRGLVELREETPSDPVEALHVSANTAYERTEFSASSALASAEQGVQLIADAFGMTAVDAAAQLRDAARTALESSAATAATEAQQEPNR